MNKVLSIIKKDSILRFASKSEFLFFLILPLVFTFLLAGGTPSGEQDNRIRLLVVDQAETELSQALFAEMEKSIVFRPVLTTLVEAEESFGGRRVSAMLVIPQNFDTSTVAIGPIALDFRKLPNNLNGLAVENALRTVLQRTSSSLTAAKITLEQAESIQPFDSEAAQQAYFDASLTLAEDKFAAGPDRLQVELVSDEDPVDYDPAANSSAGQMVTWVFIPLLGLSQMFAGERQQGTLRRLLTTPTTKATYLLGTILGQVFWAFVQLGLLIAFGILAMRLNWGQDLGGLVVLLLAFTLSAAALGTFLGTLVKTESQANGLSIMLGMVMALLGGCWYPIELFPEVVRNIVKVLPTTWVMQGMLDLVLRGQGLSAILPEAGVLFGFALVFFILGILRFRYE